VYCSSEKYAASGQEIIDAAATVPLDPATVPLGQMLRVGGSLFEYFNYVDPSTGDIETLAFDR
jgi:hypothetical protein